MDSWECLGRCQASETFVSHFYGRMPFVLECGELVAGRWTLEDPGGMWKGSKRQILTSEFAGRLWASPVCRDNLPRSNCDCSTTRATRCSKRVQKRSGSPFSCNLSTKVYSESRFWVTTISSSTKGDLDPEFRSSWTAPNYERRVSTPSTITQGNRFSNGVQITLPVMDFIYIHGKLSTFLNLTYESLILLLFCGWGLVTAASHILQGTQKKTVRSSEKDWQFLYCAWTNWANIEKLAAETNSSSQLKSIEVNSIHLFGPPLTKHGAFEAIGQAKAHSFMADDQRDREATEASVRQGPCGQPCNGLQRRNVWWTVTGLEMGTWVISSGNSLSPHLARICEALQCSFQVTRSILDFGKTWENDENVKHCEAKSCKVSVSVRNCWQVPFVTTNVYISRLDSPITAPLHTDRFDSFIMQTEACFVFEFHSSLLFTPKIGLKERTNSGRYNRIPETLQ